ncbi:hypothetical protein [Devosia sp. CN2-171]|jgi:hypothetical protein|uniref:hypothetical protein n=1 Tax=Devosia sp. CN2-171 TaxID=3400909 RepID=UPI003BF8FBA2
MSQQVFGPEQRGDKWYFYAYVDGQQVEWGPYRSKEFAEGAMAAIDKRIQGLPPKRPGPVSSEAQ